MLKYNDNFRIIIVFPGEIMAGNYHDKSKYRLVGYAALIERHDLDGAAGAASVQRRHRACRSGEDGPDYPVTRS
jgi:hypothetical protein